MVGRQLPLFSLLVPLLAGGSAERVAGHVGGVACLPRLGT